MKNIDLSIIREGKIFNKQVLESTLFALTVATLVFAIFLVATAVAKEPVANSENIVLNTSSHKVIEVNRKVNEIVLGESMSQRIEREARERAEAEARAAAETATAAERARVEARKATTARGNYGEPTRFDEIYKRAEATYGVDWRLLRAVHYVETGQSGSTSIKSYAGAQGPMQFLPSTWRRYAQDGNGDGSTDINNVDDAIFGAANYLRACGYPNVKKALWGYNRSTAYFNKVMSVANSLGFYA